MLLSVNVKERSYNASLTGQSGECYPLLAKAEESIDHLEFTPGSKWEDADSMTIQKF